MTKIKIKTPSRIHITLIDLNGSIGRVDGGIGFALKNPYIEIVCEDFDGIEVEGGINRDRFERVATNLRNLFGKGLKVNVLKDYEAHVGLGSGTQISLAVAKAFNDIYNLGLSVRELAEITGRGGTSGIGVAVFESGGFVLDGGHSLKEKPYFLPSSASKAKPPKVLARYELPDWYIVVAIPRLKGMHGKREINVFEKYCPIPIEEVKTLCHIILMKLLPSVVEKDLDSFCESLKTIQYLGFKKIEIDQYGRIIWNLIENTDFAIGMSSMGPAVYSVTDTNAKDILKYFEEYFDERNIDYNTYISKPNNSGAEIRVRNI